MGGQTALAADPGIAGDTCYLPLGKLVAWEESAKPGQWLCFAVGPQLDTDEPVVATVERRRRAGRFTVREEDKAGARHWIAVCQVASAERDAPPPGRIVRDDEFEATPQGKLYMLLVRLANVGMPCPSNAELARRLGWEDKKRVEYRLSQLVAGGRVRSAATGSMGGRIITIIETGKRTGDPDAAKS